MSTANNTHSYFWRHAEQFQSLAPELTRFRDRQPVQIWCAGCAQGEEAYSLAFLLQGLGLDAHILATDTNREALGRARQGVYRESKLKQLPDVYRRRFVEVDSGWQIPSQLKKFVTFRYDDLRSSQIVGAFDLVFCRNVLIYFSASDQGGIIDQLSDCLGVGGLLVLGYAESSLLKLSGLSRLTDHAIFLKERPALKLAASSIVPGVSVLSEALSSYANGQLVLAGELLDASLEEQPFSPIGLYFKGMLELESGKVHSARHYLGTILDKAELFDSETEKFLEAHGMSKPRFYLTVRRVLERLTE